MSILEVADMIVTCLKNIETVPITKPDEIVLEVKCNDFIPAHITAILNSVPKLRQAISKFAYCRTAK